jgi:hypothetical protein
MIGSLVVSIWIIVSPISLARGQAADQSKCVLNVDQSPSIRGLRLGMSADELFSFFPGGTFNRNALMSRDEPTFGVGRLAFSVSSLSSQQTRERFDAIELINIVLFDGRLAELKLNYTGPNSQPKKGPYWRGVDDLVTILSEALRLPPAKNWVDRDQLSKILRCTGFVLTASLDNGGSGSIALRIATAYEDTVRQRTLADEERKRREFKP